ncbi:TonB-dependent receptor [Kordiimonas laminariae]|uniref:TonB-dependent receptor n=1 Tax=Kordiimonas laminariae TaxID=2917717 RepID=UPI001FF13BA2|nr:TonB-dependent receptor [Kordiimonas laminariae]MCK0070737.1 TonB-dependent receptor [Kordiimonas laminariae]
MSAIFALARSRYFFLYVVCCLVFVSEAIAETKDKKHYFDIEQTTLTKALRKFAAQARISLSLPHLSYRDGKSVAVKGYYTVPEGLELLLHRSGLTFEPLKGRAVKIYKEVKQPSIVSEPQSTENLSDGSNEKYITEILVSARRKTETLFQLPVSASVYTFENQTQLGRLTNSDIVTKTAGLHAVPRRGTQNKIVIRGISDGAFNGRVQSLVSTYIDFSRANYNTPYSGLNIVDIEQIEILRGPQGTLYGSGAISGIYKLVPNKPKLDDVELKFSIGAEHTKGGAPSYDVASIVNLPIVSDKIGFRTSVFFRREGGYIDDLRLGITDTNSNRYLTSRSAFLLQPTSTLNLILKSDLQYFQSNDSNYYDAELGDLNRANFIREPLENKSKRFGVLLDFALKDLTFVSETTWHNRKIDQTLDASVAASRLIMRPDVPSSFFQARRINTFLNETHVASKTGYRLEFVAGTFFSKRTEETVSNLTIPGNGLNGVFGPVDAAFFEDTEESLQEVAVFGEATYYFTDKLSSTLGLRWFNYKANASTDISDIESRDLITFRDGIKDNGFIPKVSLSYQIHDNAIVYGQVSKGYRLGGFNLRGPTFRGTVFLDSTSEDRIFLGPQDGLRFFEPDFLTSYEIGFKYRAENIGLNINTSGYYSTWNNIQSLEFDTNGLPISSNVGDANVYGIEVEVKYTPMESREIIANFSWNQSSITQTNTQTNTGLGNRLPGVPALAVNVSGRQDFILFGLNASLAASYNFVGSTRLVFNQESEPKASGFHQADASIAFNLNTLRFSIYVENIFDSRANIFPFNNPFNLSVSETAVNSTQVTPPRPRTIGFSSQWQF